jgi:hypothetical protein
VRNLCADAAECVTLTPMQIVFEASHGDGLSKSSKLGAHTSFDG